MLMQRISTSFKNRRNNSRDPEPPMSSLPEDDQNVYSDEDWSDTEFDPVEYDLYADPNTAPHSRLNAAPPVPPTMSPKFQKKRYGPLPPTPTAQALQDDNGEGLYMGPADAHRGFGRVDHTPPRPPNNQHNAIMPRSNASPAIGYALQDDNGEGLYMGPADAHRGFGRVDHTPPRPPNNQHNAIMPRSNALQTIGLVEDEGIYMGPGDANPHTRRNHAPPLPPDRHAPRLPDQEETTENDSISGIFRFLDAETCSSIVSAEDDKEDYYETIDVVEGLRSNRPSPGSLPPGNTVSLPNLQEARNALRKPSPAGTKPPTAPKPIAAFHGFPVAKPRIPPQTPPKPSYAAGMPGFGMRYGGGVENHGVVTGSGHIPSGNDIADSVRTRILAGAKKLPTLPVNNMPKLKSPEIARRNISPSTSQQGDLTRLIPPTPPPQARKPPWAIQRQIRTPLVTQDLPPQPPPSFPQQRQPQTPSGDLNDLYHYHWYHGALEREHVNERLYSVNQHGAYLVRKSSRGGETMPYALSILFNDKVWNLHIRRRHDNSYALGTIKHGEMTFNSIPQLVEYHRITVLILSGSFGGETTLTESPRRLQQFNT